jgi:glycosyltransferase involved in cell wall biosynthesis
MSLLLLDPVGGDGWGGVERWMTDLGRGLVARGHRVCAAGKPDSIWTRRAAEAGFPACAVPLRSDFGPRQAMTLARFMRREGVDVVATKLHRGIRAAGFAARFAGRPPVVAIMGLVETSPKLRHRWTYRLFLDRVITLTEQMAAQIAEVGGFDRSRVAVIPQGIRVEAFDVPPGTREAARAELGLEPNAPVAVGIGRLHEQKRYDLMLDAFSRVVADAPSARLLIVGTGALEESIRAARRRLGLDERVHLLGFRSDVPRILAAADVLVMSSDDEGVPVVALEAMAAGRPVVATRVGSMEAAVEQGRTGVLVARGDPAALADALRAVLLSRDRGAAMGAAARARVVERFRVEQCVADTERFLLSILPAARA